MNKRKVTILPAKYADHGTKELQQKFELGYCLTEDGYKQARIVNQRVIDKLLSLGTIDNHQHMAAEKLFRDYFLANFHMELKCHSFREYNYVTRLNDKFIGFVRARIDYEKALKIFTFEQRKVIEIVVINDDYLKNHFCTNKKGNHSSKLITSSYNLLRDALDTLVIFYGFRKKIK